MSSLRITAFKRKDHYVVFCSSVIAAPQLITVLLSSNGQANRSTTDSIMRRGRFATAINCIDGRVQTPVLDWVKLHLNVDYVDLITEPGPDRALAMSTDLKSMIFDKLCFSLKVHNPVAIAVAGHWDCLANPVSKEEHLDQIRKAVAVIEAWRLRRRALGLWVNEWGYVDLVSDTEEGHEVISFSGGYDV